MNEPLAIVGMACRLPGADGLDAFWKLVVEGRTAWGPLPESRLPRDLYFHPEKSRLGKSYSELGAVVADRPVDPAVCPITPDMLERFDVAHTIFLEVASQACRDAGLDPFAMPADRRTGVYVGHTGGSTRIGDIVYATGIDETARLLTDVEVARTMLGGDVGAVADEVAAAVRSRYGGRQPGTKLDLGALAAAKIVQQALRLDGPYLVVDAACASSLQAMAIAARAVLEGSIDQAIVGGASYCKSDSLVLFSAAQSVSNSGSCPFGRAADGLVTAEGYVALVIKKLSRAIADGDRIRAVIRGLGVASDGKGKSLWAPRQEGQVLAVERAYPDAGDIARIEYIEAHATSTQVGDATELAALSRLMGRHLPAGHKIPIGSVKANIGHTLETAGIASLVKVVLAMEHGAIPPGTTARELNDEFDWAASPFSVPFEPLAWRPHADGSPRCAAVNAFGIGGLNVHVSLAEHVPAARPASQPAVRPAAAAIAIVGAGCVLPGALSIAAFCDLLDRGATAIGPVPADRWDAARALDRSGPRSWHTTSDLGGFVRDFVYDWRRHKVPPKQIAAANPLQFMLLEAADAAIQDAGGPQAGLDRTRTGVVVGTLFGGDFANQLQMGLRLPETRIYLEAALRRRGLAAGDIERLIEHYEKRVLDRYPALVDETGSFTSSTLASRLTKTFDLMGGALALDAGDCSSLAALGAAVDMLRQGTCDAVLCAAGERCMDLMAFEGRSLGGYLADRPVSVLDGGTSGGDVAGEGAVVFVLKRLADAKAAGNPIRGVIRGLEVAAGRSREETVRRVVREGLERSGLAAGAVTAAEVSAAAGHDRAGVELEAVSGRYVPGEGGRLVAGSLDGQVGHLGAAAGAAGLVKLARALATGRMPGTAAVRSPARGLAAASESLPLPAVDAAGYRAGSLTVIQDEQAGHVVIDNGLPVPESAKRSPASAGDASRVLPSAVTAAAEAKPRSASAAPAGRPLVAAIFPGQGSQYTDMFRGLVEEVPAAGEVLRRLDAEARAAGCETLAEIAWRPDNGLGTKIWDTQWAMYLSDLLAWGVLESFGFAPDYLASHSFGEFPALAAGGAWSIADGIKATRARAAAVERHGPRNGAMLSVIADAATVNAALEPFGGQAWICAANAPEQYVVGGTARIVDAVEVLLESRRVKTKRLAVPSPFHTPLLQAAADELAQTLHSLPLAGATIETFSSTTLRPLDAPAAVLESLVRQMTETVRWIDVVRRLYEAGVRTFVEVGPSGVLTGLARRILEGRNDVTFLQVDQRGRSPREHLERVRQQLAAAGCLRSRAAATPAAASGARPLGRVVSFDATARRRQRNRAAAAGQGNGEPSRRPAVVVAAANGDANGHGNGNGNGSVASRSQPIGGDDRSGRTAVVNRLAPAASSPPRPQPAADSFLEDVVGDLLAEHGLSLPLGQNVESDPAGRRFLDALQHLFGIAATDRAGLLGAGSLAALCDVLAHAGGKADWLSRRPHGDGASAGQRNGHAASPPAAAASHVGREIETFLVEFVVEQTGYPAEIVELDADLEADLGIDSIRKAQLFGEVGQRYGLGAEEGVSLDDFPTLRHLIDYLVPRVGGGAPAPATNGVASNGAASNGHAATGSAVATKPAAAAATAAPAGVPASGLTAELETFLVEFVVEQTGYPAEIVELDADLEADLGIDSIRKAQLFGEVGQRYGLGAEEGVSLDDFPTLRHLIDYLVPRVGGGAPAPATNVVATNGVASNGVASNGVASNGVGSNGHAATGSAVATKPAVPPAPAATAAPAGVPASGLTAELETFLVEFVVEQTGYPAEIVELDADLEADLGIDSIRKAQLFGEVGQRYGLGVEEGVSLDDFPTLRHLIDYLVPRVGGGAPAPATNGVASNGVASNGHAATGSAVATKPAAAAAPAATAAPAGVPASGLTAELETFLVEFVVEQTGYPAEIVELDADLEADLGIDSIRKAQLFGEVGQRYGLGVEEGVSLDDFPTLRHLIDYLVPRLGGAPATATETREPADAAAFTRGLEAGREHAGAIRAWARQVADAALAGVPAGLPEELADELAGIAEGAGVDESIVRAGLVSPAAALGGCDVAIVTSAAATLGSPGLVACFGRHAEPGVRRFDLDGLAGGLVRVPGLPGAVLGWNDAGLAAVVAAGGGDTAAGLVVERIVTTCRSPAEARVLIAACAPPPRGLVIASAEGAEQVGAGGAMVAVGASVRSAESGGPLVRVALADGGVSAETAIARLLDDDAGARDALSAACTWLAVGGGADAVESGGPRGRGWLDGAPGLGVTWLDHGPAPRRAEAGDAATITRRYELELGDAGPVREARSLAGERVAILGAGPRATALERALADRGALPLVLESVALADPEAAAFAIARAEVAGPVRHLVVVAADAADAPPATVAPAFVACQKWIAARSKGGDLAAATLTAVCDLGGFGLAATVAAPIGGGLAGLFKGIAREFPDVHVRVLDAPGSLPATAVASAVIAEMTDGTGPVEVCLVAGRRLTVVAVDRPVPARGPALAALASGSCWLVTGGARGVTAACARELGRRHGVTLVLVGSTRPVPVESRWASLSEAELRDLKGRVMLEAKGRGEDPRRAWAAIEKSIEITRSLEALRAAGVNARYEACDLADAAAVRSLVAKVAREAGPVRGIVHGAGWESACRFEKKTLDSLAMTVGPKCAGLVNLLAAVDPESLDMLVAFGSTSGRLGGHGQADYSLANDMLAKFVAAARQRRPRLRAATFHWHAWDEVGMASRPESRFVLEQFGLKFMPLAEGVGRFMAELEAGLPVAEVLVSEPAMVAQAMAVAAPAGPVSTGAALQAAPLPPRAGSLVASVVPQGAGGAEVCFRLDPLADRFLVDHLQHGRPLLPAVMGAELVAQAALAAGVVGAVGELRDFVVERPLGFPIDAPREVRVEVDAAGVARGLAAVLGPDGQPTATERVHFRGQVVEAAEAFVAEVGEPPFPFNPMVYQESAPLRHGPSFRTLDGLFLDRAGGWGRLTAPRGDGVTAPRGSRGWTVPAALLDGVIVGCAVYSFILCGRRVEIPVRFGRLRLAAQPRPGEKCVSRMFFREQTARETIYDVVVAGEDGRPILAIDALHLAVMAGERSPPA